MQHREPCLIRLPIPSGGITGQTHVALSYCQGKQPWQCIAHKQGSRASSSHSLTCRQHDRQLRWTALANVRHQVMSFSAHFVAKMTASC